MATDGNANARAKTSYDWRRALIGQLASSCYCTKSTDFPVMTSPGIHLIAQIDLGRNSISFLVAKQLYEPLMPVCLYVFMSVCLSEGVHFF